MSTFISTKSLSETISQETLTVYDSGIEVFNRLKLSYRPGDVIILGSRPSMGKSLFLLYMFSKFWEKNRLPQAFISNEDTEKQVYQKLVAAVTGWQLSEIMAHAEVSTVEKPDILHSDNNFFLTDFKSWEILKETCTNLHNEKGVSIFYIDKIHGLHSSKRFENRSSELGYIIEDLKKLAIQHQLIIFVTSGLNRAVESREGKRPQLSDLRETGAFEENANIVIMLHRPEYYGITEDDSGNSLLNTAEILVLKNRNGKTGDLNFTFNKEIPRFEELKLR